MAGSRSSPGRPAARDGASPPPSARPARRWCAPVAPVAARRPATSTTGPRRSRRPPSSSRSSAAPASPRSSTISTPSRSAGSPTGSAPTTATSTCSSTTSGAASGSRSGTRRSGSTTSTTACACSASPSTRTSSPPTTCCRCSIDRPGGLLVEVADGTADYNATRYRLCVYYDLAKVAVNRLGVLAGPRAGRRTAPPPSACTPGWLRSEMMLENFGVTEETWRDSVGAGPTAPGRRRHPTSRSRRRPASWGGRSSRSPPIPTGPGGTSSRSTPGALAQEYGFTDVDGSRPDVWRYIVEVRERDGDADLDDYR